MALRNVMRVSKCRFKDRPLLPPHPPPKRGAEMGSLKCREQESPFLFYVPRTSHAAVNIVKKVDRQMICGNHTVSFARDVKIWRLLNDWDQCNKMQYQDGPPEWHEGTPHWYCLDNMPDGTETDPENIRQRIVGCWESPCPGSHQLEKAYSLLTTVTAVYGLLGHFDSVVPPV